MELSNNSLQRQLVAEKKRTIGAQEEARTLQEELERLTNKLKVKHNCHSISKTYYLPILPYSSNLLLNVFIYSGERKRTGY